MRHRDFGHIVAALPHEDGEEERRGERARGDRRFGGDPRRPPDDLEGHVEDDNFTIKRQHVVAICERLIARDLPVIWSLPNGVRIDRLDPELLRTENDRNGTPRDARNPGCDARLATMGPRLSTV